MSKRSETAKFYRAKFSRMDAGEILEEMGQYIQYVWASLGAFIRSKKKPKFTGKGGFHA